MNELKLGNQQQGLTTAEIFTYVLIVIVLASTAFGFYHNYRLDNAIAEALVLGEEKKGQIEKYFEAQGQMPQSEAETGLDGYISTGVLKDLRWRPGVPGDPNSDKLRTGTLNGIVDLVDFGARFEEYESGYLLIARAQEDGSVVWDCLADAATANALP
jgi:hypothetical protein